ncbi:MAG: bifunctional riboflavin kinase/FAD synthetase [Syntrophobacterales bacterium]|nr:bifunctional riboflavin kinase/FAD synthetase [Syntrophobacterales bacterium]
MEVIEGFSINTKLNLKNPVVTIGNFDGVHKGHQALINTARERAKELGGSSVVITFSPHPVKVLCPECNLRFITPHYEKLNILAQLGVDYTIVIPFSREFASITAQDFILSYLVHGLGIRWIVVGYDYHFGRGREGNIEMLKEYGNKYGFGVDVLPEISIEGFVVSSTAIRKVIKEGRVHFAARLLGRSYSITGPVLRGRDRGGKLLGFPTANVDVGDHVIPKEGVYATWVTFDGKRFKGATNIGYNPTFGETQLSLEVHILGFNGNLYGKEITVSFEHYIRGEKKFSAIEELIAQISQDVEIIKLILR